MRWEEDWIEEKEKDMTEEGEEEKEDIKNGSFKQRMEFL